MRLAYQGHKIGQMKAFPVRHENQSIWEPSQLVKRIALGT